jgi:FkbM family methyltransferase
MTETPVNMNIANRTLTMFFNQEQPVHNAMLAELSQSGTYERATQLFLCKVLRRGDTFVDVGAHIGYFSMLAAAVVGESDKVVSVEPTDENFAHLQRHIDENNLTYVSSVKSVISGTDGDVTFHINKDNDGGHALWEPGLHPQNEKTRAAPQSHTLPSMTLDNLLGKNECAHVRLMKIDTEGAESMILESGRERLTNGTVDFILAEVNSGGLHQLGSSVDQMLDLARDLGFVTFLPENDGGAPIALISSNLPDPKYVYNVLLARPEALATI